MYSDHISRKYTSAHRTYMHKCEHMPMLNITDAQGLITGQIINLGMFIVMYLISVRLCMLLHCVEVRNMKINVCIYMHRYIILSL